MVRRRWWVLVKDVNGTVIHTRGFRTRRAARRYGTDVTSAPLNRFELRLVPRGSL